MHPSEVVICEKIKMKKSKKIILFMIVSIAVLIISSVIISCQEALSAPYSKNILWDVSEHWDSVYDPPKFDRIELLDIGKKTYDQVCYMCHDTDGNGNGPIAKHMVTKPRNFRSGKYKFRTTAMGQTPKDLDLFRTITIGFPEYGMPSFYHLSEKQRWGLVQYIKQFDTTGVFTLTEPKSIELASKPSKSEQLIIRGEALFNTFGCQKCHIEKQSLTKPPEPVVDDEEEDWFDDEEDESEFLVDSWGNIIFPLDFRKGTKVFKTGSRAEDIYRILVTGINGTPMPSFRGVYESEDSLWALAYYVEELVEKADQTIKKRWEEIYQAQLGGHEAETIVATEPEDNWDSSISRKFKRVSKKIAREKGCLSCHEGIEIINSTMYDYLYALGGGHEGRYCVVCHEGNADAITKKDAHNGIFPNPGSMWVVSTGKGCGKCHSNRDALNTLHAHEMPHSAGGSLMEVISTVTDPSGKSGSNHIYRMQRGLMATEFGKASHTLMSNGVVAKGNYIYADYHLTDPDGLIPSAGTSTYKTYIEKAITEGFIKPVERAQSIPTFDQGMELWNDEVKAAFSDYYRKECGRCHVWEEGRRKRGDLRAGGCSSCHVLYTNDGLYEGSDPTIPKDKPIHPMKHEITIKIPAAQCNHCHTRGKRIGTSYVGAFEFDYKTDGKAPPWDDEGNAQELLYTKDYMKIREDVHFERGMQCIDCHTSIDVHGDGNIYPTTLYQVEIQCQDCHGTPDKYPWELPVGYGTPVELDGDRGIYATDSVDYMITSRGNPRSNLAKTSENSAMLTSFYSGKEHDIPLLKDKKQKDNWRTEQGKVAMSIVSQHIDKLECYSCHSTWAPQCYGCHTKYDRREFAVDWVMTGANHDPHTGKQNIVKTRGKVTVENRSFMRWENPTLGINLKGKVSPVIPGCQVFFTYIDEEGEMHNLNKTYELSDGIFNLTMAPVQPHANAIPARTCESCHTNPKALGYGTSNSRSVGELDGDRPMFQNLSEGFYGDIPGSKTAKWQVPKIPEFPYALDQLVTRSGKQVQNMPHLEDRPLNKEERDKVEREGLCVACHKHYNTPTWDRVRKNLRDNIGIPDGIALTPEQHDLAVEAAVLSLAK